jgi:pyrimidine operon attenuation protein / uracil phosphoribosyltransferase
MKIILSSDKIDKIITDLAKSIVSQAPKQAELAVIGIRSRGEILGQRLAAKLAEILGTEVPCGTLDITLYRDDINNPQGQSLPQVRSTEIGFDIDGKIIILADDVLHTGRSTRAALDALIDLGRPEAIKLAVLIDRLGREFPIQADFIGHKVDIAPDKSVQVNFAESDGKDQVIVD